MKLARANQKFDPKTPLGDCPESGFLVFLHALCSTFEGLSAPFWEGEGVLVWTGPSQRFPSGFGFQLRRHWFQGLHSFSSHHVSPSGPVLYLRRPLVPPKSLQQERGMFCRKASSFKQITLCPTCSNHRRSCKGPVYRLLHQVT